MKANTFQIEKKSMNVLFFFMRIPVCLYLANTVTLLHSDEVNLLFCSGNKYQKKKRAILLINKLLFMTTQ